MFRDRREAGRELAKALKHLRDLYPIVLGLPRGGVVVASEVARSLNAPLDVVVVRKIGAPHQPEFAIGAVTASGGAMLHEEVIRSLGLSEQAVANLVQEQLDLVSHRESLYRSGRAPSDRAGRTVIVVDDGIATGATVRAVVDSLRKDSPRRIVVASPVAPPDTLRALSQAADEVVCLLSPPGFRAVGQFYADFGEVDDEEVARLLAEARPVERSTMRTMG